MVFFGVSFGKGSWRSHCEQLRGSSSASPTNALMNSSDKWQLISASLARSFLTGFLRQRANCVNRSEHRRTRGMSTSPTSPCEPYLYRKLVGARFQLYRRRFLQVNTRWKALDEIFKIHKPLHRSELQNFAKFRRTFF